MSAMERRGKLDNTKKIAPALLSEMASYDRQAGIFTWLERPIGHFKTKRAHTVWNIRYAGRTAFSTPASGGYSISQIFSRTYRGHQVAWAMVYGAWPIYEMDHINGDRSDNRISNLRLVSRRENSCNRKRRCDNTSGASGVFQDRGRWVATIADNGKRVRLGCFAEKAHAIAVRKEAEWRFGYHPNHDRTAK